MDSKTNYIEEINPSSQLELLKLQCNKLAPKIYRAYALYLQVLRSILLNSVRNAILTLITSQDNDYLDSNIIKKSKSCQLIIDSLVTRCSSLLTVEQVVDLARDLERENQMTLENARELISR